MPEYIKTRLPEALSVRSIVTVFHRTFENYNPSHGEAHDFPELLYVEKGPHSVLLDGTLYEMESGQLLIYAPLAYHQVGRASNATVDIVSFEAEGEPLSRLFHRVIPLSGEQRAALSRLISAGVSVFEHNREMNGCVGMAPREGTSGYVLQQLKNQLELFLIDLLHPDAPQTTGLTASNRDNYRKEQFDALTAYLNARLGEPLTLERISSACGMSVSKLKRLCQAQCGCAPIAYLISLRLAEAKRMIRDTSMNLTQIAECLGFQSVYHFSRLFKRKTGMTPSEYAKLERKK